MSVAARSFERPWGAPRRSTPPEQRDEIPGRRGRSPDRGPYAAGRWRDLPPTLVDYKKIFADDLCHRCGACVGVCPTYVLELDEEQWPFIGRLDRCTDCGLCVEVCPGLGFDFDDFSRSLFGVPASYEANRGHVRSAFLGYATNPDIRRRSTSGGIVTGLLAHLIETGELEGALVVGSDSENLWAGRGYVARSREELLSSMVSKYVVTSVVDLLADIRKSPGRFALVGIPCQIHGFRKLERLAPAWGRKIALTIGLYCHATLEYEALRLMFDHNRRSIEGAVRFNYREGKLPGTWAVELADGRKRRMPYPEARGFHPNAKESINFFYKLYAPGRCLTCIDAAAEFADLAVGDAWLRNLQDIPKLADGYSLIVARSEKGERVLEACAERGALVLEPLAREEVLRGHDKMIRHKRERAFFLIERHRRRGRIVPDYGIEQPPLSWKNRLSSRINVAAYALTRMPRLRRMAARLLLSPVGRFAFWLNRVRKPRSRVITPEV